NIKPWLKEIFNSETESFNRNSNSIDIDRYILSSFTRMRYCYRDYKLDFEQKGPPTEALDKKGLKPWFHCENAKEVECKIIFGHWSTLGLYENDSVLSLDTGCLWGGQLTAARIDSNIVEFVQIDCA
ncbi:MAG: symmetrical bis(5'-nucleosyl)-tetraphosphatase, partial [Epsilonproteobacteria bacterium]